MSPLLRMVLGIVILLMAVWGLITGQVMAGSKGLQPNYYHKNDNPGLYYTFIVIYLVVGTVVLVNAF